MSFSFRTCTCAQRKVVSHQRRFPTQQAQKLKPCTDARIGTLNLGETKACRAAVPQSGSPLETGHL